VALLLVVFGLPDAGAIHQQGGARTPRQNIITPALMMLTMFFMLLGLSSAGIGNFGVVALMSGYGASFSTANMALTAYLGASAAGVLAGGFLADRNRAPRAGRRRLFCRQRSGRAHHCDGRACRRCC